MPQMTQILLSNAESGREKGGVKPNPSDVSLVGESKSENNDFSEALAKASTKEVEHSQAKKGADTQVELSQGADNSAKGSSSDQVQDESQDKANESGDVANVLAQIDLASKLGVDAETGSEIAAGGAILPPDESEADMAGDDALMPSIVKGQADKFEMRDGELEEGELKEIVALVPPVVTPPEILPVITPNGQGLGSDAGLGSEDIVAQLPEASLDQIMAQSGLTKEELIALPPQMLQAIIHGIEGLGSQAANGQSAASQNDNALTSAQQDIKALIAQAKQYLAANSVQSGTVSIAPSSQQGDLAGQDKTFAAGLAAGKEAQSILADPKPEMKPSAEQSRQTEFIAATSMQTRGVKAAVDALKDANLAVSMTPKAGEGSDISGLDKSGLISAQSLTGLRAESAPQYQLSIKPQGEPAAQMQEMIQKFSPVMRQQLVAMVSQGVQQAEIRLDPPELGHMMVRVQVQGEHTQVQFHVTQTQTRDLVEQAIPRLREMLAEQGMQLTDSNVSQGGQEQGDGSEQGEASGQGLSDMDEISAEESLLASNNATSYRSGIDYYA
ncbi:flagellar hook-length control protein FliK [Shewanella marisflavi]|uniref:flagellar hook-length control protein FliK n=1 Tax=Shewanella marisflavi TaxID=260364 RepID=UPI003AACC091